MSIQYSIKRLEILEFNSPPSPLSSRREGWRPKGDGVSYIEFNNKLD